MPGGQTPPPRSTRPIDSGVGPQAVAQPSGWSSEYSAIVPGPVISLRRREDGNRHHRRWRTRPLECTPMDPSAGRHLGDASMGSGKDAADSAAGPGWWVVDHDLAARGPPAGKARARAEPDRSKQPKPRPGGGRINVNTATEAELESLPG